MNTQLMFLLDILSVRFITCAAIGHWSSGCHNIAEQHIFYTYCLCYSCYNLKLELRLYLGKGRDKENV